MRTLTENLLRLSGHPAFGAPKGAFDHLDQARMIDVSRRRYHQVVISKLPGMKRDGSFVVKGRDCLPGTLNWPTERLIREISRIEQLAQKLVGRILDHFHLFEDDFLFTFQVALIESRFGYQVAEEVNCLRKRGIRNLYCESSHLMGCIGIKMTPEAIGFHRYFMSRAPQSSLKHGMLNKMTDSVEFGWFVS